MCEELVLVIGTNLRINWTMRCWSVSNRMVGTSKWPNHAWWCVTVAGEVRAAVCLWVPDHQPRALHQVGSAVGRAAVNVDITVDGCDV